MTSLFDILRNIHGKQSIVATNNTNSETYICSDIVAMNIREYCQSRQHKKNPCKKCKYCVPDKFNTDDCIFTKRVKDW